MARFTLRDRLVQESLKAISDINRENPEKKIIIVGGTACQAYSISPDLYRPTNDIDSLTSYELSAEKFKRELGPRISEGLASEGYPAKIGKSRYSYEVESREGDDIFFLHICRFSKAYLERHREWKKREIENARQIELQEIPGYPVSVYRIEDILANKARRIKRLKKGGYLRQSELEEWEMFRREDFDGLGSIDLGRRLEEVEQEREGLLWIGRNNFSENIDLVRAYKSKKDTYDIALLSRAVIEGKELLEITYLRDALSTLPDE